MNGYVVSLIVVLVVFLIVVLAKALQRHDPPRQHHWPEGLDVGNGAGARADKDADRGAS